MTCRSCSLGMVLLALLGNPVAVRALVTQNYGPFTVHFYGNGETPLYGGGASVQDWTAEMQADFGFAITQWDSRITNAAGRSIVVDALWQELGTVGSSQYILGGSYSPSYGDGTTGWNYGEHIWRDGVNYDGLWDGFDTRIVYDVTAGTAAWNFGADAPLGGEIDFRSVIAHELGHSLGFSDTYDVNYDDWGNAWGTAGSSSAWANYRGLSQWDQHLQDAQGDRPLNGSDVGIPGEFDESGAGSQVYWTGAYANTLYGGFVPIYTPDTYEPGSSLSHLDQATFSGQALMPPAITTGTQYRAPAEVEWAMMADMGWSILGINAVPEPTSLFLLAVGVGAGLPRRRTPQTAHTA